MAAKATFALKAGVWFRRGRLVMVSPEYAAILAAVRQKIHLAHCSDSRGQPYPDTFNQPWQAAQRYERVQQQMIEDVCAENGQQLFDYHIPVANKPDF